MFWWLMGGAAFALGGDSMRSEVTSDLFRDPWDDADRPAELADVTGGALYTGLAGTAELEVAQLGWVGAGAGSGWLVSGVVDRTSSILGDTTTLDGVEVSERTEQTLQQARLAAAWGRSLGDGLRLGSTVMVARSRGSGSLSMGADGDVIVGGAETVQREDGDETQRAGGEWAWAETEVGGVVGLGWGVSQRWNAQLGLTRSVTGGDGSAVWEDERVEWTYTGPAWGDIRSRWTGRGGLTGWLPTDDGGHWRFELGGYRSAETKPEQPREWTQTTDGEETYSRVDTIEHTMDEGIFVSALLSRGVSLGDVDLRVGLSGYVLQRDLSASSMSRVRIGETTETTSVDASDLYTWVRLGVPIAAETPVTDRWTLRLGTEASFRRARSEGATTVFGADSAYADASVADAVDVSGAVGFRYAPSPNLWVDGSLAGSGAQYGLSAVRLGAVFRY